MMGVRKAASRVRDRPEVLLDLREHDFCDYTLRNRGNHYAIRLGNASILMSKKASETVAWAVLQKQAKMQRNGAGNK